MCIDRNTEGSVGFNWTKLDIYDVDIDIYYWHLLHLINGMDLTLKWKLHQAMGDHVVGTFIEICYL